MSTEYDVIIIGSGAGGGTLAHQLAPSGKRILMLERGDWLKREQQNWDVEEVFIKNRYVPKETWYDKTGKPFQPGLHYFVGGATKMFGAALYRLSTRHAAFCSMSRTRLSAPAFAARTATVSRAWFMPNRMPR
jgi:choline dehydrogenase-like flavoprotein